MASTTTRPTFGAACAWRPGRNTPDAATASTADHAVSLLLTPAKTIVKSDIVLRANQPSTCRRTRAGITRLRVDRRSLYGDKEVGFILRPVSGS